MNRRDALKCGVTIPFISLLPNSDNKQKEKTSNKYTDSKGIDIGMSFIFFPYKNEELRKHYLGWIERKWTKELWAFVDVDGCWWKWNGRGEEMTRYFGITFFTEEAYKKQNEIITFGDKVKFIVNDTKYVGFVTGIRHENNKIIYGVKSSWNENDIGYRFYVWILQDKNKIKKIS